MKKYIHLSLLACILTVFGCENNFDAKIYGSLSTTNFPQSEADYESYMMDCYIPFTLTWTYNWGSSNQHNFYVAEGGINRMLDTPSDICAPWTLGGSWGGPCIYMAQGQFEDMKYASTYSNILPSHFDKVRDITRMTKIIGTLEESTVLSDKKKQELVAESRLLRGLTMFYLLHFYGPVPVIWSMLLSTW